METPVNQKFSGVFRGYKLETLARIRLNVKNNGLDIINQLLIYKFFNQV